MLLGIGCFQHFPLGYLKCHQIDYAWIEYGRLYHNNQDGSGQEVLSGKNLETCFIIIAFVIFSLTCFSKDSRVDEDPDLLKKYRRYTAYYHQQNYIYHYLKQ